MIKPWTVVRSKLIHRDQWISVRADDCETSAGVEVAPYYVLEYSDWSDIVALNDRYEVLLIKQYRHGLGDLCIELPGGIVDPGEDPLVTAERELLEETGYTAARTVSLGSFSPNPSTHTNKVHYHVAYGATKTAETNLDQAEEIESFFVSPTELLQMISGGEFQQGYHIGAVYMALQHAGILQLTENAER